MVECHIIQTTRMEAGPYVPRAVSIARCRTHNYELGEVPATLNMLCPIGRIEWLLVQGFARLEKLIAEK